ncbi:prepilin-type N-terminal cleavage/methylation domain-containing protein [Patescibacteria group bacterium]|jgi:prepilin-type N-terminal cleavage/methylation domain-containing protein|nr:prepilin-type N-terminal cleavage/methylation domain-containing protein [Patescibacteria group bacterium]
MAPRGFTLVETLIAIAILTITITGLLTVMARMLSLGFLTEDELTASFLASDAVEFVKSVRDTDYINDVSITDGASGFQSLFGGCFSGTHCELDTTDGTVAGTCGGHSSCSRLSTDGTLYGRGFGTDSPYRRSITLEDIGGYEYRLIVEVSWQGQQGTRSVTHERLFYDL